MYTKTHCTLDAYQCKCKYGHTGPYINIFSTHTCGQGAWTHIFSCSKKSFPFPTVAVEHVHCTNLCVCVLCLADRGEGTTPCPHSHLLQGATHIQVEFLFGVR